jgi:hypothetical protein
MSVRNGQFQLVGDQKALGQKPIDSPSANPRSGQFQIPGDEKKMNHSKSVQSPSANPRSAQFQIPGDQVALNRAPVKGWASAAKLAMSDRALKQSQTAAGGGRGKGKR